MLYSVLYNLGVHIGSKKFYLYNFYKPFLIGYKQSYCIFDLQKVLFYLKRAAHLFFILGQQKGKFLFYYHSFYKLSSCFKLFFFKELNKTRNYFFDEKWTYGQLSNLYTTCYILFLDVFNFKETERSLKTFKLNKEVSFFSFFFSLLFFTFYKKVPGMDWDTHIKRIKKYWRFFLFFKFYRHLNRFPDLFLYFSSIHNFGIPAIESNSLKVPTVCVLDTDYNYFDYVSYPVFSNTKNIFVFFFYFVLFISNYKKGTAQSFLSIL